MWKASTLSGNRDLGFVTTKIFDNYLIIPFSKDWIYLNAGKPIEFNVVLTKEGKLVLSGLLSDLDRTKDVSANDM